MVGGGDSGTAVDLTGLTPEQIAQIGNRREIQNNSRTKVSDLLRQSEQSKISNKLEQGKLKLGQDQLAQKSLKDKGLLDLGKAEIDLRIAALKQRIANEGGILSLNGRKLQLQVDELESLDNYRSGQLFNDADRNQINKGILDLRSEKQQLELEMSKNIDDNNLAKKNYNGQRARALVIKNDLYDQYLRNGTTGTELKDNFTRSLLGLPVVSESQRRLRTNDATEAEINLLDNGGNDELFEVDNGTFINNVPDTMDRFYVLDKGNINDTIEQIPLPPGITFKTVREDAKALGISVEQMLDKIYQGYEGK